MSVEQINRNLGDKPDLRWVPVDRINIDRTYQRETVPRRVAQILRDFSWDKFGAVMLAEQPDGTFNVYDGQHRLKAADAHPDVDEVPAAVVRLAENEKEAGAFRGVNVNRTAVGPVQRYWAGITAGDKDALRVQAVLDEAGCYVVGEAADSGHNRTNAVTSVSRAIKSYGDTAVIFACSTIAEGWSTDKKAQKGTVITALARVHRANDHISRDRVVKVLERHDRESLSGSAETLRKISGGDAPTAIAKAFCELYNKGLQKGQIYLGARG